MNRIVDTLKDANIEVSGIEQELLLSYVKELHNVISGELKNGQNGNGSHHPGQKEIVKSVTETPAINIEHKIEPSQTESSQPAFPSESKEIEKTAAVELAEKKEVKDEPAPKTSSDVSAEVHEDQIPSKLKAIFEIRNSNELSDKLSLSPIKDLRKSMGVNERIFTINELFGGDQKLFDDVFQHLNAIDNYSDAAEYLIEHVAIPNNWQDGDRKKKAEQFVKLVYRRYL